jgi:hypothetical protein
MKIASFNINDINRRLANLLNWLREAEPDIVCLQELKSTDVEVLPQIAMVSIGRIAPPMRCVALLTHSLAACIRAYGRSAMTGFSVPTTCRSRLIRNASGSSPSVSVLHKGTVADGVTRCPRQRPYTAPCAFT